MQDHSDLDEAQTIKSLIAAHDGALLAIGEEGKSWLSYADLRKLSTQIGDALQGFGLTEKHRVAIVLPNGALMATCFITLAQACTTAPLNPNLPEEDYRRNFARLSIDALIIKAAQDTQARKAAESLGIKILELHGDKKRAGWFHLTSEESARASFAAPTSDHVALILHTSGTTSTPKIVPLLQRNITASAKNIARTLSLSPRDRGLNIMPLFHIHGLVASLSASLAAGASVWCSAGFNALSFFAQMKMARPTWYTAVPTMHQAILARAERNIEIIKDTRLRFLRSSSASLPSSVMTALSRRFDAPVIEAYGMTEAAHQMCSNPLDLQKPGAVGREAGPKVAIASISEDRLISGMGEVVISGPNVTPGYEDNPKANSESFFEFDAQRWFRTGDQGKFDEDGYLILTGRLKEMINRGGEKISPLEVDDILMEHPAVRLVVTFAVPHDKLGEEVAAAIVLKEGFDLSEGELRDFAKSRMAAFKIPRQILFLAEIPTNDTGKMQRIGMAEKLGLITEPS